MTSNTTQIPQVVFISINIGNTHLSIANSQDKVLYHSSQKPDQIFKTLSEWMDTFHKPYLILCSVVSTEEFQQRYPKIEALVQNYNNTLSYLPHWKNQYFFTMPVNYATTLGIDRLIQTYFLWKYLQCENLTMGLMIDAGTMTTIDVVSKNEGFIGGYIVPGLDRYADIFTVAKKLPAKNNLLPHLTSITPNHLPKNTPQAICSAYWHSYTALIDTIHSSFPFSRIMISGGNAPNWQQHLLRKYDNMIIIDALLPHRSLWQIGKDVLG